MTGRNVDVVVVVEDYYCEHKTCLLFSYRGENESGSGSGRAGA